MLTDDQANRVPRHAIWIGLLTVVLGSGLGLFAGASPLFLGVALGVIIAVVSFFARLEQVVLGLLVMRSAIDCFVLLQLPAAFAMGLNVLTILYLIVLVLTKQTVRTDKFLYFFVGWLLVQGIWVFLLPLGALGFDGSFLLDSAREWIRLLSWVTIYLLILQLKDRLPPEQIVSTLFWSLVIPLLVALVQMVAPSVLTGELSLNAGTTDTIPDDGPRIRGTLGHANNLATHLFFFIGLTWWKLGKAQNRLPWLLLLGLLMFFYVGTKSLFSIMMLGVFFIVLLVPRLSIVNLLGTVVIFGLFVTLFGSSEFGQERLGSIGQTPLMNPDIDISRAILLSQGDNNSFNWRLSQWYYLLGQWKHYPILGYGLGLSIKVSSNNLLPHNDYVRFLVEEGVVGLVAIMSLFVAQGARLIRILRETPKNSPKYSLCLVMLGILAAIPVGMITENIWGHTMLFLYWWTVFAVLGWDWDPPKQDAPVTPTVLSS